jgi:hypothetical protein
LPAKSPDSWPPSFSQILPCLIRVAKPANCQARLTAGFLLLVFVFGKVRVRET